jgi:hypothetical protein
MLKAKLVYFSLRKEDIHPTVSESKFNELASLVVGPEWLVALQLHHNQNRLHSTGLKNFAIGIP